MLKIMFLSEELSPFSRVGKTGDIASGLSRSLKAIGHEVRVVTPRYTVVRERQFGLRDVSRLKEFDVHFGSDVIVTAAKSAFIPKSKVQVYFIEHADFYNCGEIYGKTDNEKVYPDNAKRFAFLVHAGLRLVLDLNWHPDIIYCCGRMLSFAPYIIRTSEQFKECFSNTKIILQISPDDKVTCKPVMDKVLGLEVKSKKGSGKISLSSAACSYADLILNDDGQENDGSEVVQASNWFEAIDTKAWNPLSDSALRQNYGIDNLEIGKTENRVALEQKFGWSDSSLPIPVGVIWLHSETQEAVSAVQSVQQDLAELPIRWVLVGDKTETGKLMHTWSSRIPKSAVVDPSDEHLLRLTFAGADLMVIPNCCGVRQPGPFCGLYYGALPVACKGRDELLPFVEFDQKSGEGCGFSFPLGDSRKMVDATVRAAAVCADNSKKGILQRRAMQSDCSWLHVARQLEVLFSSITPRNFNSD